MNPFTSRMQKLISISIALLFGCLLFGELSAQSNTLFFHNISTEDGLPQSSVSAIVQDPNGFMWFGTEDGLARYDGYAFKVYRNILPDSASISNNFINALMVDENGRIWIGTRNGLSIYNPASDNFTSYFNEENTSTSISSSYIISIFQDSRGDIFISTNNGLNKVISNNNKLTFYRFKQSSNPGNKEIFAGSVHDFAEDDWGRIWIASQGKDPETREDNGVLTSLDTSTGVFTHYYAQSGSGGLSSNALRSLHYSGSALWAGTIDGGLNKISFENSGIISEIQSYNETSLPHNYVSKIIEDGRSNIWIGTYEGLVSTNHKITEFKNSIEFEHLSAASPPIIRDLFSDNANNLWVATDKGLYVYFPFRQQFKLFMPVDDANSLAAGDIFGIYEDSINNLWTANYGTGLSRISFDKNGNETISNYTPANSGLPATQTMGIIGDNNQNIWLASFDGLIKISKPGDSETPQFTHFSPEMLSTEGLPRKYYTHIYIHPNGSLWVRTYQNGFDEIRIEDEELQITNHDSVLIEGDEHRILSFFMDESGTLWIITNSFLVRGNVDQDGNLETTPVTLTNVQWEKVFELNVNTVLQTKKTLAWIGTSNGLAKLTFRGNSADDNNNELIADIKIYTENDGMSNNTVYAMAADNNQNLWLSTNKGLSRFTWQNEMFSNYLLEGGAAINEFNEGAVAKGNDGQIYFGGIGGLVSFHPDSILQNPFVPPVAITDFLVQNEKVSPSDERLLFSEEENILEQVTLPYTDDFFTIHFAALNFNQPEKNEYSYKLHGFHDEWINSGNQRQATFTNLDNGEYTFQVKGSNNDGVWNETGASLRIIILPPFWETWYAYIFYIFAFLLGGYLLIRQRIRAATKEIEIQAQIERAKHEERERFRKKTSQDFHDEAGNKITKINLFTELAKAEAGSSKELSDFLRKIEMNTRELSAGMRDFIWTMDPEKDTLFDTLMRIKDFGNSMFSDSDIDFEIDGLSAEFHDIKLPMDIRRTILQVFKEAMNNCVKYALAHQVNLKISVKNSSVKIALADDGIGFDPNEAAHQKGYGTKIMKERAEKIGGELTITSKKECGTEILLQFNIPHIGDME